MPRAISPWPLSFSLAKTKIVSPLAISLPPYIVLYALNVKVLARESTISALIANTMLPLARAKNRDSTPVRFGHTDSDSVRSGGRGIQPLHGQLTVGRRAPSATRDMIDLGGVTAVGGLTDCDTSDPPDELAARFHIHSAPLLRLGRIDVGHPFPDFGDTQTQRGGGGLL